MGLRMLVEAAMRRVMGRVRVIPVAMESVALSMKPAMTAAPMLVEPVMRTAAE